MWLWQCFRRDVAQPAASSEPDQGGSRRAQRRTPVQGGEAQSAGREELPGQPQLPATLVLQSSAQNRDGGPSVWAEEFSPAPERGARSVLAPHLDAVTITTASGSHLVMHSGTSLATLPAPGADPATGILDGVASNAARFVDHHPRTRPASVGELVQDVQDLAFIGQGASGNVYRGRWQGAVVAIKYIVGQGSDAQAAANEARLGLSLAHPNVVQTFSSKTVVLDDPFFAQLTHMVEAARRTVRTGPVDAPPDDFQLTDGGVPVLQLPSISATHSLLGVPGAGPPDAMPLGAVMGVRLSGSSDLAAAVAEALGATASAGTAARAGSAGGDSVATSLLPSAGGPGDDGGSLAAHGDDDAAHEAPPQPTSVLALQEVLLYAGARLGDQLTQIVMEFCDKGSLAHAIKRGLFLPSSRWGPQHALRALLRTAQEVAQGMWHIHQANVIHGDLKPGNVLLRGSRADRRGFTAKISDFGLSRVSENTTRDSRHWGTVAYMAPETFDGLLARQSDVYSFGITLWQMVTGQTPWEDLLPGQIIVGVQAGTLSLEWPSSAHPRVVRLGQACLQHDRKKRPVFSDLVKELTNIEDQVRKGGSATGPPASTSAPLQVPATTGSTVTPVECRGAPSLVPQLRADTGGVCGGVGGGSAQWRPPSVGDLPTPPGSSLAAS